ncbi:hypothetical protein, conserved [Leishmania lindenbergi]|uniref:TATA element modulatory factor 1 TATA binding domain-containing protein n=1 Tax=Leishmania lindenbergi TaxID=651832 RepID=A0AAW3AQC9_9TRYP
MWSSFLDQIQQRIGDAVDLLGDEEEEEGVQREDEKCAIVAISDLDFKDSVLPQQRMREQPVSSFKNSGTEACAGAWEDDKLVVPSAPPEPCLRGSPPAATVPPAPPTLSSSPSTPGLPVVTLPPKPATLSDPTDVIPSATASLPLAPTSRETGQQHPHAVPSDTTPSMTGSPLKLQEVEVTIRPEELAAPPPISTLSTKSSSLEGAEVQHSVLPNAEDTTAVASDTASVSLTGNRVPSTSFIPPLRLPATTEPSSPPSVVTESFNDVGQLLRFQQQLAEEMDNVVRLQCQNASLKDHVSALEEKLANATASLTHNADSEQQVSLLIERLGKEKERYKSVVEKRDQLKEHVQDLEEELEEYRAREEAWVSGQERQQENEITAQQRIAQLENDTRSCNTIVDNLRTQLREAKHLNGVLQSQMEELKLSYSAQLYTAKESSSDTVDQLRQEVEQLRSSLQNLSTEYDTRTADLEREVQNANMRACQAEARLSEMALGSVNTLQDLRRELEDSQRSSATWKAEVQKTRNEYTELLDQYASLKRSRAAAEADLRDRLSHECKTVATLRGDIREWEDRYLALQESLGTTQTEIEDQRKTIMQLESTIQKLRASRIDVLSHSQSEALVSTNVPPVKAPFSEPSLPRSPLSGSLRGRVTSTLPLNPFMHMERSAWSDSKDGKTRERLEQEVLRQSAELERMRAAAVDAEVWKAKHDHLQEEHDLLLQLYGQLEEDVSALRRNGAGTFSVGAAVASSVSGSVSAAAAP